MKATQIIPEHELFEVYDSSKIQDYATCHRKYFFSHVLGWRPDEPSVHLEFGTAVHLALEILLTEGYTAEAGVRAFQAFMGHYEKFFGPEMDDANSPKNPDNFLRALPQYMERYMDLDSENVVKHVEVAIAVGVGDGRVIHAKSDCIWETPRGMACLEHKTGSRNSRAWEAQWRRKIQAATYNHVLYCLYPDEEVYGVVINGIFLTSPPKTKKDGTPYANTRDNEFRRVPIRKNLRQMEAWLVEINWWIDEIQRDFDKLWEEDNDKHVMEAFQPNSENCTKFNQPCPFIDQCSSWPNPLEHASEVPSGFHAKLWDPRDHEYAREKLEIGA